MMKRHWWKWAVMSIGIVAASWAALAVEPSSAKESRVEESGQDDDTVALLYRGSGTCINCHIVENKANQPIAAQGFIRFDEYTTWKNHDKHSLAYSNLTRDRGRKMAELLKTDVTKLAAGCIGCHGAGQAEQNNRGQGDPFDPFEGVSCENCHGPSTGWFSAHLEPSFRKRSTEYRQKKGMNDLRSPSVQAEQCLTCHIGDSGQGKVVTHEMYSAGHPPLPSIEVSTFSDVIPRHWWLVGEKKSIAIRKSAGFVEGTKEKTRLSLVGAAVALKTSMKLLADETKAKGDTTVPGLAWPDYARFDCWSCHHDLKRESWRQERGYQAAPGRPPISEWPLAIVKLGIARLGFDDPAAKALEGELLGFQKAVLDASNARPYGQKVAMADAADKFAAWSDGLIKRLAAAPYDDAIALRLLKVLVDQSVDQVSDYDAARHIAWTIKILAADSGDKLTHQPEVAAIVEKFNAGLKLDLPAGREYEIEDQLSKGLQIIGDYEPSKFREHLKELQSLLAKP